MVQRTSSVLRSSGLTASLALLLVLSACDSPTQLIGHVVQLTLDVTPTSGVSGDTIQLVGIAHNPSDFVVEVGLGCAPGISFHITRPDGRTASLYQGLLFTCQGKDSNWLEPGETDTVRWSWPMPDTTGAYQARAALEFRDGQINLSSATVILVQ
jgi:hypothetical protein